MTLIRGIYTKRPLNPGSLLIRMVNPVSLFKMSPASHVIVVDGASGYGMEASASHGVRRAPLADMLKGLTVVQAIDYQVPNAESGLSWMRQQTAKGAKYDFKGALGLGLGTDRNWQDDDSWFCFEYFCKGLVEAGRPTFVNASRVGGYMLMSLDPNLS